MGTASRTACCGCTAIGDTGFGTAGETITCLTTFAFLFVTWRPMPLFLFLNFSFSLVLAAAVQMLVVVTLLATQGAVAMMVLTSWWQE